MISMLFMCDRCGAKKEDLKGPKGAPNQVNLPLGWAIWAPRQCGDAHPREYLFCSACHQGAPWRESTPDRGENS